MTKIIFRLVYAIALLLRGKVAINLSNLKIDEMTFLKKTNKKFITAIHRVGYRKYILERKSFFGLFRNLRIKNFTRLSMGVIIVFGLGVAALTSALSVILNARQFEMKWWIAFITFISGTLIAILQECIFNIGMPKSDVNGPYGLKKDTSVLSGIMSIGWLIANCITCKKNRAVYLAGLDEMEVLKELENYTCHNGQSVRARISWERRGWTKEQDSFKVWNIKCSDKLEFFWNDNKVKLFAIRILLFCLLCFLVSAIEIVLLASVTSWVWLSLFAIPVFLSSLECLMIFTKHKC